jgi:hypothetical protein
MLINIIFLITGAVIGGLVSYGFDILKTSRHNKIVGKSVKTLFDSEIEKNKSLLIDFWVNISLSESYWFDINKQFEYSTLVKALNDMPFPNISLLAWKKQFNLIPDFYEGIELRSLWDTYNNLELLIQLKDHLIFNEIQSDKMENKIGEHAQLRRNIIPDIIRSSHFTKDSPALAKRFKETIERLIGCDEVKFKNREPN